MKFKKKYKVLGLMSGTSLDGLDVAYCEFELKRKWGFRFRAGKTFPYSAGWKKKLSTAHDLSGEELMDLHAEYGRLLGVLCSRFIRAHKISGLDFIASHGHTIFHQPKSGFTFQLGDGTSLFAAVGLPVVCDFRSLDVALGGEGAPLVPMGDKLLFSDYDACLNLGGIANVSMDIQNQRRAFDICFCNMALNHLTSLVGKSFDDRGRMAASGNVDTKLLESITELYSTYAHQRPSLAREMFEKSLLPILTNSASSIPDKLRTLSESIALEIAKAIPARRKIKLLATGGGTLNIFLVGLLQEKLKGRATLVTPPDYLIEFKEAIVFGLLGVLRARNEINVLRTVTRARQDSSGGVMIGF